MSLIHKALQQSANSSPTSSASGFNPLSEKPLKQPKPYGVLILCGCLILATAIVLIWPKNDVATPLVATLAQQQINPEPIALEPNRAAVSTSTQPQSINETDERALGVEETVVEPTGVKPTGIEPIVAEPTVIEPIVVEPITEQAIQSSDQTSDAAVNSNRLSSETSEIVNQDLTELIATSDPAPKTDETAAPTPTKPITLSEPAVSTASATSSTAPSDQQVDSVISSAAQVRPTQGEPQTTQSVIQTSQSIWASQVEESLALGQIEQAEIQLKQWIGAAPNDPIPRTWLARIYISNGAEKAAEPLLSNQTSADAKGLLGIVYERTARPDLAATIFESLYRTEPSQGKWLLFWAINSERSGQFEKSQQLYQTYLNLFSFDDPSLEDFAKRRLVAIEAP